MCANSAGKSPSNILLVAITRLGDMLQASPTIVGLKEEYPEARITVLIDKQFARICAGIPGIDEVYVIDLNMVCRCLHREHDGLVDAYRYVTEMVEDLRQRDFDYCFNMSSSAYTALLIKMLHIPESRGWVSDDEGYRIISDPWAMLFAAFVYHSNRDYNGINLVDIFRCGAGVRKHPNHLVYRVSDEARRGARAFLEENCLQGNGPLICIQAGASQTKRQWPIERFAQLTKMLVSELNARVLYTGAPNESEIIDAIISLCVSPNVLSAAGKTDFQQLGALLEQADVLVTGDTGPMHLSIAVGTPVVAMFLASALCFETGPYSAGNFVVQSTIDCHPCNPNYPCSRPDCHLQISPELIAHLVKRRIELPIGAEGKERVGVDLADPRLVSVYLTEFDSDGFLAFRKINPAAGRRGYDADYFDVARAVYARLWKEEFGAVDGEMLSVGEDEALQCGHPSIEGLRQIMNCAEQGKTLLNRLQFLIQDVTSPPVLLGETSAELEQLDKTIEEIGLVYPVLGALVRIFIMEKENLQGNDPLLLASEMERNYRKLAYRSKKFGKLHAYYEAQLKGSSSC